ncbi:MAG: TetR/AcrR family transcriptional regulator [Deltaproteobacteria bacterium]|nr:TetR/AcrR family transcriptional regulator [Deltaproteobacteria bacterium]
MLSRKELSRQRAEEIYATAGQILCQMGYEKASIRDIAAATGMTKAGLYYYFSSKEELLFIILDGYMDQLLAGIDQLQKSVSDPEERLKAYINFQVQLYCRDVHGSKLIIHDENCLSGEWHRIIKDKQRAYLVYWRDALEAYCRQTGKELPFPSAHVMLLVGLCNWIYQWYDPQGPLPPDQLAELIFQRFFRGFSG